MYSIFNHNVFFFLVQRYLKIEQFLRKRTINKCIDKSKEQCFTQYLNRSFHKICVPQIFSNGSCKTSFLPIKPLLIIQFNLTNF